MQRRMKKGTKRLCSILLAAVLSVTCVVPAFAVDGERMLVKKVDEAAVQKVEKTGRSVFDLQVGDIVQPGEVFELLDWQREQRVTYYDYDSGLSSCGSYYGSRYGIVLNTQSVEAEDEEGVKIAPYVKKEVTGYAGELKLSAQEFGGWKVMTKPFDSEGAYYTYQRGLYLMAVPKNVSDQTTVTTVCKGRTKNGDFLPVPDGAGVELYVLSSKTGEIRKSDASGKLVASPGDVVYAVTKPVAGYYSTLDIKWNVDGQMQDADSDDEMIYWYDDEAKSDGLYNYMIGYSFSKCSGMFTFLPEDVDVLSVFALPHTDVSVTAEYVSTDKKFTVAYYNGENEISEEKVPLNKEITVLNPDKEDVDGADVLFWWTNKSSQSGEYYKSGEKYRVTYNVSFSAKIKNETDKTITVSENSPLSFCYANIYRGYRAPLVEADSAAEDEYVTMLVNAGKVTGTKSLVAVYLNEQEYGYASFMPQEYYPLVGKLNANYDVEESYMEKGEDFKIDLTNRYELDYIDEEALPGLADGLGDGGLKDDGKGIKDIAIRRPVDIDPDDYDPFEAYPLFLYEYLAVASECTVSRSQVLTQNFMYGYIPSVLLDLNEDGAYDVMVSANRYNYDRIVLFERLDGAKYCEKASYDIDVKQSGYGKFTIQLFDTQKVEYISDGKTVYTQEAKKGLALEKADEKAAVKKDGYTLKGWSTAADGSKPYDFTAIVDSDLKLYAIWEKNPEKKEEPKTIKPGDVIKDNGNSYTVLENNEVNLSEVTVKDGKVIAPDTITVDGVVYKVVGIDKGAFKNAKGMKSLDLGVNVKKLLKGALKDCKKLKTIKIRNKKTVLPLKKNMFGKLKGKITLKVNKKMVKKYKQYIKKKKLTKYFKVVKG